MGRGDRCYRHSNSYDAPVPSRDFVLILKDSLSQASAWLMEEIFILMYGRKCDGGVLDNKARGGRGWGGGSPATKERKQKISDANRGRHLTDEHKRKLSEAKQGKPQPYSATRLKNIRRSISLSSPQGDIVMFESSKACALYLSVHQSTVSHLKRGKIKSIKGYTLSA